MPAVRWLLILFSDVDHINVFKVLWFSTISEVASVLNMTPPSAIGGTGRFLIAVRCATAIYIASIDYKIKNTSLNGP